MEDISFLLIKPEVIDKEKEISDSLQKRGYTILLVKKLERWGKIAEKIYTEFSSEEIKAYIKGYEKYHFADSFIILIVKYKKWATLKNLIKEQGNFISYQNKREKTLRGEFGLSKKYNIQCGKTIFTFPGVHCPKNEKELISNLRLFEFEF